MGNTALQLSDLKVSNLPELQGWKEKQEQLVTDNPYIEITDNKSYEVACKSRTSLLKGRTELEKQDKLIASKLTAFRKDVKTETDTLIAITLPSEEKQQAEVKRYEGIKEAERLEKERIEKERVDGIKAKIESIETESFAIIQKMTFQNVIPDGAAIGLICKQEFDFEEYDILFEQTLARIENAIKDKIDDLNEREEQRLRNEELEKANAEAKRISDLQASRLTELLPFNRFGADVSMPTLWSLTEMEYSKVLESKKALFEADAKEKKEAQDKLDAKVEEEKEAIYEIRKKRLLELEPELDLGIRIHSFYGYSLKEIKDADAIDFETIITDAKLAIEKAKEEYERAKQQKAIDLELSKADAERLKKENKARVKRLSADKYYLSGTFSKIQDVILSEITSALFENEETETFRKEALLKFDNLLDECITELEKL